MSSPIADLSYRNYDGPMAPPVTRWWPIAVAGMKLGIKKKGFWAWSAISSYGYFLLMIILYFIDTFGSQALVNGKNPLLTGITWHDTFVFGFSYSMLLLLIVALMIGAPTIANDNRSNALLVYLSRPCTKFDYLFGKWLSIFIPITAIVAAQTLIFYGYGVLSLGSYGFVSQDPWLILKLIPLILVPGIMHASLSLGISSLFDQGRLAVATYVGLYFVSLFFTLLVQGIAFSQGNDVSPTLRNTFYCSIDGIQIGLAKLLIGTDNGNPIKNVGIQKAAIGRPDAAFILLLFVGACAFSIFVAWQRIKPVQVVGN